MRPGAFSPATPSLLTLAVILSAVLIFVAGPGWSQTGKNGWQVFPTEDKTECVVGRTEAPFTLFFESNFNDDDRHALVVINKSWSLEREVELARLELVGRGGISVPTVFSENRISLVFPAKDDANNARLLTALGKTDTVEVLSDRLPDGGKISLPVSGFADVPALYDKCVASIGLDAELAGLRDRRSELVQAKCDAALEYVTLNVMLTDDYDDEQRGKIRDISNSFDECGQPVMGRAVRAAMLDKDYNAASGDLGDLCVRGYVPACHFGAVLGGYGKNPRVTSGAARSTLNQLCRDGLQLSCTVRDDWNR
ncbi:hypothetical protein [Maritimibacter dapengensis]|uniref:Uncharacterized protein n=1 Tax=Maritimibacter dapengensis TaxID=2836868 RepID=A0ABS6T2J2_9RHOB|nr:hypothetical protein [Maritimibacter dapengensis]MBV7379334.1 hypothetical protein [Maritimibacter dapengensis]